MSRRLGIAAGLVALSASAAARSDEALPAPQTPKPLEIRVRATARAKDPGRVTVSVEEARRVPGAANDALKVIESLPGVARTPFDSGKVVLWGAAPEDSRIYVDGVEIPALFHESGLRGTINDALVQSVEVVPGAFGADYGRSLGGLVRLKTRDLPESPFHGYVGADLLDASFLLGASASKDLRVAASGRTSYLDRVLAGIVSPSVGDYVPIPRYDDFQAKATIALRDDERLSIVGLGSLDFLTRTLDSPDPARVRRETISSGFQRAYVKYDRDFETGENVSVVPFFGHDQRSVSDAFGGTPARLDQDTSRGGIRASYRMPVGEELAAIFGVDALVAESRLFRSGSMTIPAREGDLRVFGQPPGADVNSDRWSTSLTNVGPHVTADLTLGRFSVRPAVRVDAFLIESSRLLPPSGTALPVGQSRLYGAVDPRIAASLRASNALTVSAAFGVYHQAPEPADLSAVFGTPKLALQHALHGSASASLRLRDGFSAEVTGYYKSMDHLVVRSRLPTPTLAQALTQDGEGRSMGVEVQLRKALRDGLMGWVAYTASRSERRYVGDAEYRLFDYDLTHVLSAVVSYEYRGYRLGTRFRYTTGAPRTPVVGSFVGTTFGRFEPELGPQNSTRLPDFCQLDLRLDKTVSVEPFHVSVYLDVLNVTNQRNAEELAYSYDYSRQSYVTGLPTLGILGVRIER